MTIRRLFILLLLFPIVSISQIPQHIQVENEGADWSNPLNLVVLIGIPVFIIIFGLVWKARLKAKAAQKLQS